MLRYCKHHDGVSGSSNIPRLKYPNKNNTLVT